MKCISKSRSSQKNDKELLGRELKALRDLPRSPFLMRSYLAFESSSTVFFVTDLVGGGDLFYHLDVVTREGKAGFPEHQARVLLAETAMALCHMHDHNFIHRDIKVENVMLSSDGHVRLVDYGLCCQVSSAEGVSTKPVGSLIYMAPEMFYESLSGHFTDWWALGILGHELLTGRSPWSSLTNRKQIKWEIMNAPLLSPLGGMSEVASEFIVALTAIRRESRLGFARSRSVLTHRFFTDALDMDALERGEAPPSGVLKSSSLPTAFDEEFEADQQEALLEYAQMSALPPCDWDLQIQKTAEHPRCPR